jgi:ankyrin repeat protein
LYDPDSLHAREEMPPSKKKRGQAARGQPAGGEQLLDAVGVGDTAGVARLLAAGADPNASVPRRTQSGEVFQSTPLREAAGCGRLEAARLLLDAGADPSLADGAGFTPLVAAATQGQRETLRLLLRRGAAVDAVDLGTGGTAFHCACSENQVGCAEELARAGCNVGLQDKNGQTGRELAEARGHAAVVERMRAVVGEQLRAAQVAVPAPAPEPAAVFDDGGPMYQLVTAAAEGDGAAVARLLAAGADPNALVPARMPSGKALLGTALCMAAAHGRLEVARLLLDGGADPSLVKSDGATPLMAAALNGRLEVARLLLERGADPSLTSSNGLTPLVVAATNGQQEMLRLLLTLGRGAAVDAVSPDTGGTAFHSACFEDHAECAEELARSGCDVGIKNTSGLTGREVAEWRESKEVTRRLRALARQPFVGVLVELAGLVGAAEHNGKRATVMSERPSRGHHTPVFLARAHFVCTLREHRRTLCVAVEWRWN